ncbi:hypothetical protein AB834_05265 [PVC group bacterium (ex Bugula neritina AB1)]|nr:hypothetical protein AB834_05265 [PVC group bacterium (ex Bugula neritina AB1)]
MFFVMKIISFLLIQIFLFSFSNINLISLATTSELTHSHEEPHSSDYESSYYSGSDDETSDYENSDDETSENRNRQQEKSPPSYPNQLQPSYPNDQQPSYPTDQHPPSYPNDQQPSYPTDQHPPSYEADNSNGTGPTNTMAPPAEQSDLCSIADSDLYTLTSPSKLSLKLLQKFKEFMRLLSYDIDKSYKYNLARSIILYIFISIILITPVALLTIQTDSILIIQFLSGFILTIGALLSFYVVYKKSRTFGKMDASHYQHKKELKDKLDSITRIYNRKSSDKKEKKAKEERTVRKYMKLATAHELLLIKEIELADTNPNLNDDFLKTYKEILKEKFHLIQEHDKQMHKKDKLDSKQRESRKQHQSQTNSQFKALKKTLKEYIKKSDELESVITLLDPFMSTTDENSFLTNEDSFLEELDNLNKKLHADSSLNPSTKRKKELEEVRKKINREYRPTFKEYAAISEDTRETLCLIIELENQLKNYEDPTKHQYIFWKHASLLIILSFISLTILVFFNIFSPLDPPHMVYHIAIISFVLSLLILIVHVSTYYTFRLFDNANRYTSLQSNPTFIKAAGISIISFITISLLVATIYGLSFIDNSSTRFTCIFFCSLAIIALGVAAIITLLFKYSKRTSPFYSKLKRIVAILLASFIAIVVISILFQIISSPVTLIISIFLIAIFLFIAILIINKFFIKKIKTPSSKAHISHFSDNYLIENNSSEDPEKEEVLHPSVKRKSRLRHHLTQRGEKLSGLISKVTSRKKTKPSDDQEGAKKAQEPEETEAPASKDDRLMLDTFNIKQAKAQFALKQEEAKKMSQDKLSEWKHANMELEDKLKTKQATFEKEKKAAKDKKKAAKDKKKAAKDKKKEAKNKEKAAKDTGNEPLDSSQNSYDPFHSSKMRSYGPYYPQLPTVDSSQLYQSVPIHAPTQLRGLDSSQLHHTAPINPPSWIELSDEHIIIESLTLTKSKTTDKADTYDCQIKRGKKKPTSFTVQINKVPKKKPFSLKVDKDGTIIISYSIFKDVSSKCNIASPLLALIMIGYILRKKYNFHPKKNEDEIYNPLTHTGQTLRNILRTLTKQTCPIAISKNLNKHMSKGLLKKEELIMSSISLNLEVINNLNALYQNSVFQKHFEHLKRILESS